MCFIEQMYETNNPLLNQNRFNQKWVQKLALRGQKVKFWHDFGHFTVFSLNLGFKWIKCVHKPNYSINLIVFLYINTSTNYLHHYYISVYNLGNIFRGWAFLPRSPDFSWGNNARSKKHYHANSKTDINIIIIHYLVVNPFWQISTKE